MAISELQGKTVPVKLWTKLDDVESEALTQLKISRVFRGFSIMLPLCQTFTLELVQQSDQ